MLDGRRTLAGHADNVGSCLLLKAKIEHPDLGITEVLVDFKVIVEENCHGIEVPHVVAFDVGTGTYLYLAEMHNLTNEWSAKPSEFSDRISLFAEHVVDRLAAEGHGLSGMSKGGILARIASKEYKKLAP